MRIRGRLFTSYTLLIVVLLGVLEIFGRAWLAGSLEKQMLGDMQHAATLAGDALPAIPADPADSRWTGAAVRLGHDLGDRVTVIGMDGRVLGDSEVAFADLPALENHNSRPEVIAARKDGDGSSHRFSVTVHHELYYVAHSLPGGGMVVRVSRPTTQVDDALAAARRSALLAGLIAALVAGVIAFAVSEALSRPVRDVTEAARAMAKGGLGRRIASGRNDELGDLASALNEMAAGLSGTVDEITFERNRLAAVLAGMVEGVLVVDAAGKIVVVNPSLREIFGMRDDVVGRTPLEAVRSAELHGAIAGVLAGGRPGTRVISVNGPPERTLEVRFSVLRALDVERTPDGITGLVAVFHDVTDIKRLEQVRRDFVANASHELKTPVAAILGASETLSGGALYDKDAAPRFIDLISRNAARLAAQVQDLLDLSRLESRDGAETLRAVEPADALARAAALFKEAAAAKRISLAVEPTSTPAVRGDPTLLERALTNLVQNAVRYTPEGGRVSLRALPSTLEGDEDVNEVRFEVEDTGIGIPPQALSRIFERFYRVDPARSRELGGTGLGLAIVKHAVESMGGHVSVTSVPGRGSVFAVTLATWRD